MTRSQAHEPELTELLDALCDGSLTHKSLARLEEISRGDLQTQLRCATYLYMDASLRWDNPAGSSDTDDELAGMGPSPDVHCDGRPRAAEGLQQPPILGFLDNTILGGGGIFQNTPFTILIAAVLAGIAISIGSLMSGPQPDQIATQSPVAPGTDYPVAPGTGYVGRITGLVDCRLADPLVPIGYRDISLGTKYAIASGLMEITYRSGAKVILEGPATYEIDSTNGGYLAAGKLTGKLDEKAKKHSNPRSLTYNPFAIRTNTGTVTDLGTEFGLQVRPDGRNDVNVFEGTVKLEATGTGLRRAAMPPLVISQGYAVKLVPTGEVATLAETEAKTIAATFTRRLAHDDPNVVDLLDIVAGGDGSGWRREQGIDPITGNGLSKMTPIQRCPAGVQYQRVSWQPMIDGVFVPGGAGQTPVQIDSAGHTFGGFEKTEGKPLGVVWARAANITLDGLGEHFRAWALATGPCTEYMPRKWGLLALPNVGITFDLDAIRKAHRGAKMVRFRATAGVTHNGVANLLVFVDGQLQFRFSNEEQGSAAVVVPLAAANRFLTLTSTIVNTGSSDGQNWLVLGDPVLESEGAVGAK